ncbi:MAG: Hfq-related RNA-binding protein [Pseudanabaenaceae cyanobacterium]
MSAPVAPAPNPLGNLNTSLPSTRRFHRFIREKTEVHFKLLTGEEFSGTVLWLDEHCIAIAQGETTMIVWFHAIAYIKF